MNFSETIIKIFDGLTPDLASIAASTEGYSLAEWKSLQTKRVTVSGGAAVAIPGLHLLGIGADLAFLINRMAVCGLGIGVIMGRDSGKGDLLEEEDFACILALWADTDGLDSAAISKVSSDLVTKVGSKVASKMLAKLMCEHAGILIGQKMGGKLGAKLGAKFGAKLGAKAAAGWIPFLGVAVGAGINCWFIQSISESAESWYSYKVKL